VNAERKIKILASSSLFCSPLLGTVHSGEEEENFKEERRSSM
jgi:hypothetical protein